MEHFSKEMCMSLNQLYEKKLHKIVMLMIFFLVNDFRIIYFIQKKIFIKNEKDINVIRYNLLIPSDR